MTRDDIIRMALEALDYEADKSNDADAWLDIRKALREMLAQPRQWQGLTDEEVMEMLDYGQYGRVPQYARNFVDAIEAKLKEKNA